MIQLNSPSDIQLMLCFSFIAIISLLASTSQAAVVNSDKSNQLQQVNKHNADGELLYNQRPKQVVVNDLLESQEAHKIVSQSGVINGNQATYVEPPADFKPIIYHTAAAAAASTRVGSSSDNSHQKQHHKSSSDEAAAQHDRSTTGDLTNQLHSSSSISSSTRQQQQQSARQQPAQQRNQNLNPLLISSAEGSVMDYGSADGSSNSPQVSPGQPEGLDFEPPMKPAISRWSDWHDMSVEPDLASSDTSSAAVFQLPDQRTRYLRPVAEQLPRYVSVLDYSDQANQMQEQAKLRQFQIKGAQLASPALASPIMVAMKKGGSSKITLNQEEANNGKSNLLVNKAAQQEPIERLNYNQQRESPWKANNFQVISQQQAEMAQLADARLQQPHQLPHQLPQPQPQLMLLAGKSFEQRRASKRRRKSKSNAEVRIHQLVAVSQLRHQQRAKHQQELSNSPKEVNVLATKQANLVQAGQQEQQVSGRPQQQPQLLVKRLGAANQPVSSNSTPASNKRRVVKRRRVKTLLPVGLTSWFLGGIRDLDGRHWQLPAEVINRLVVNDVDFNAQPPKVSPPATGSVLIIDPQQSQADREELAPGPQPNLRPSNNNQQQIPR